MLKTKDLAVLLLGNFVSRSLNKILPGENLGEGSPSGRRIRPQEDALIARPVQRARGLSRPL